MSVARIMSSSMERPVCWVVWRMKPAGALKPRPGHQGHQQCSWWKGTCAAVVGSGACGEAWLAFNWTVEALAADQALLKETGAALQRATA